MPDARLNERVIRLGRHRDTPRLSVLTPFHRDDPSALLQRLARAPAGVEFVLLDDGSSSAHLLSNVVAALAPLAAPVTLIVLEHNAGRAAARNRLIEEARGEYVLFLDADLLPDSADFLARWLDVIQLERPFAAFGGLSVRQTPRAQDTALHHSLFANSDCHSVATRARAPARFTASANLLVRRDVLQHVAFDDGFIGWGWEDVDWALRAARHAPILHVDIPATHTGLDDIETLMRKSAEAGPNFARLARKHPIAVSSFPSFRVAQALKHTHALKSLRAFFAWLTRDPMMAAPMQVRCVAFKLYRATHYAEHLA